MTFKILTDCFLDGKVLQAGKTIDLDETSAPDKERIMHLAAAGRIQPVEKSEGETKKAKKGQSETE